MAKSRNDLVNNPQAKGNDKQPYKPRTVFIRGKRPTSMTITYIDGSRQRINPTIEFLKLAWSSARHWSDLAVGISGGARYAKLQIQ